MFRREDRLRAEAPTARRRNRAAPRSPGSATPATLLARFVAEAQTATALFDREMRYLAASPEWLSNRGLADCPVGRSHYEDIGEFPEDWKSAHRRSLAGAVETSDDICLPAPGGGVRWVRWITRPWRDEDGAIGGLVIVSENVTARIEAQQKADDLARRAQDSERYLKEALDAIPGGFAIYDAEDRLRVVNRTMRALYQLRDDDALEGQRFEDLLRLAARRGIYDVAAGGLEAFVAERLDWHRRGAAPIEFRLEDGRWLLGEERRTADGGTAVIRIDVTALKTREEELARKTALLETTFRHMGEGIGVFDPDRRLTIVHDAVGRLLGAPAALLQPGTLFEDVTRFRAERGDFGAVDVDALVAGRVAAFARQERWSVTARNPDGRVIDTRFHPTPGGGGVVMFSDVTERAAFEAKLAERNALLETTFEAMGEGIVVFGPDLRLRTCNRNAALLFDMPPEFARPGAAFEDVTRFCALRGDYGDVDAQTLVRERTEQFRAQKAWSRLLEFSNGRLIDVRFRPMPDGGGMYVYGDVTERERTAAALRASEQRLRMVIEEAPDAILLYEPQGRRYVAANRAAEILFGVPREELIAHGPSPFYPSPQPDGLPVPESVSAGSRRALAGEDVRFERRVRRRSGEERLCCGSLVRLPSQAPLLRVSLVDVTEQRAAEDALRSSERHFRMLIEEAPDAILLYDPGQERFVAANRAAECLFGVPREELLDRGPAQFYPSPQPDGQPASRTYPDHLQQALDGREVRFDRRIRRPSGEDRVCHVALVRLSSKVPLVRASFVDVTAQWAAEARLRAEEERFRMLIEEAPDAILLYDADLHRFVMANRAAERLFGAPRDAVLEHGPTFYYPMPQPDGMTVAESFAVYLNRALAGEAVRFDRRIRRPSGEERLCHAELVRLPSQTRLIRTSFVDVTDQKAAETKLAEVQHDLLTRQEADRQRIARELHDSLGQYLAAVAIKIGVLDRMAADDGALKSGLADLRGLTAAASDQVSNLAWELRPIALDDLGLEAAVQRLAAEWRQRSGLRFDCHLTLDRRLPADVETTLYRVLQEAITNVVKHARAKSVGVIVKTSPRDVQMVIEDDGVGFDRDDLDRGVGRLGLLGVRERLAALHGTLEVESAPGEGTTLIVRAPLPAARARPSV